MRTFKHLSLKERIVIETLLAENKKIAYIALQLGRNRSSIGHEVNRWVIKPSDKYRAELAHFCAMQSHVTKRGKDKINTYSRLKIFVYRGLLNDFSPDQISGSLRDLYPNDPIMSISYEAIYQHIYRHRQSNLGLKLIALLPYAHSKRRNRNRKEGFTKQSRIPDAVSIDERPQHIQNRQEIGHLEGDLIIGIGQKSAVGTIVDRKSRFVIIVKVENRKSETVTQAFARELNNYNQLFRKSMTYDNGMEMSNHKWLTQQTGMKIYFAHPYSSWERGTNENTNGLIRRYFPKKTDFSLVSEEQLKAVQNKLNNRPRKCLKYKTPKYILEMELALAKHRLN